jgi:hypothetical protein
MDMQTLLTNGVGGGALELINKLMSCGPLASLADDEYSTLPFSHNIPLRQYKNQDQTSYRCNDA